MRVLIYFFIIVNCIFAFPGSDYKEPAAVKKFFPSTPLVVATPSIAPGRTSFTTQREMLDYLGAIHKNGSSSVVNLLGPTKNGNYIPIFVLSRNKNLTFKNPRNGKPTIMLIGQQHGDEPMSSDILMGSIKRVSQGSMNYLLDKINIVIMPRINPDGAANFTRVSGEKMDINDDHQNNYTVEASSVRMMYDLFLPEVFVDLHESIADMESYSGILEDGALPYFDIFTLYPTNPNYPKNLRNVAMKTTENLIRDLKAMGYTGDYYYNPFIKPKNNEPLTLYRATSDKGLARNAYGLLGSLSYLIETRGRGIGFENVGRRLNSGLEAVKFFLEDTYHNSDEIKALINRDIEIPKDNKKLNLVNERIELPLINIKKGSIENTPAILIKQSN
ncbi:MAG: M14 family zinc carboxypeptidase [Cetobacterium sp.]